MPEQLFIPVIDLFAGPGGLGEGFSAFCQPNEIHPFKIALSIEMDEWAHKTLELRSFFRQFPGKKAPSQYYAHLRGEIAREELFTEFPDAAKRARQEAWRAELGVVDESEVDRRIQLSLKGADQWVLCGGPPCQAFSVVGRSRNGGIFDGDHRVYLYKQYLRILSVHEPTVFVMENVKGLLSSTVKGRDIFQQMLEDLHDPSRIMKSARKHGVRYALCSVAVPSNADDFYEQAFRAPGDFVVKSEDYGIPQARHRVIIVGVREDMMPESIKPLELFGKNIPAGRVLKGLPRLRSGLSDQEDGKVQWREALKSIIWEKFMYTRSGGPLHDVKEHILLTVLKMRDMQADRGAEFIPYDADVDYEKDWFLDSMIGGVCNHSTRKHMVPDLHRYMFAACYAKIYHRSPELKDFPPELHPDHRNLKEALKKGHFDDRFRVQMATRPAATVTSHLSKDGHYFIHYDETQCRSLTVRESARLQTFPDNYFFCGPRTHQYKQVGNAVPPLLARQIAAFIFGHLVGEA